MRPLRLSMSAFGPYAGTQVVDFTELGDRSFFLIHGPTGSGKTTILDAICFALYGSTSGAQRDGRQMRSDHAHLSITTEVVFDFTVGESVYRIRRNPEQERPKKKGAGTTVMGSNATLWKGNGLVNDREEGTVIASGTAKVTEAVEQLLGFKDYQFRQVVVLPQGDFRELLTANSKKRQEILETLFHTEIYRLIELSLKESTKKLEYDLNRLSERKEWILKEAEAATPKELKQRHEEHKQCLKETTAKKAASEETLKKARAELTTGHQIRERIKEKKDAESALSGLESRIKDMDAKRILLERARLALSLVDAEKTMNSRRSEAKAAAKNYEQKLKQQKAATTVRENLGRKLAGEKNKEPEREAARKEVTRMDDLVERVKALEEARGAVHAAQEEVEWAQKQKINARESLTFIQKNIEEKTKLRDEMAERSGQVLALELRSKEAEQLLEKRKMLERLRSDFKKAHTEYQRSEAFLKRDEDKYRRAKEELLLLQETWNKGQAAIMARKLAAGKPCPVCGSLEHPAPAQSEVQLPSEEEIKNKQREVNDSEIACEKARQELKKTGDKKLNITVKIEDLENTLGEYAAVDLPALQLAAQNAKQMWVEAQKAGQALSSLNQQLEGLKKKETTASKQLEVATEVLQKANLKLGNTVTALQERESGIPEVLRDLQSLRKAQKKARELRDRLIAAYEQAQREANKAELALVKAESEVQSAWVALEKANKLAMEEECSFERRLEKAGFSDFLDYQQARRTPEEIGLMEETIKKFDENLSAARDRVKRAQKAAGGLIAPDMERLTLAVTEAEEKYNQIFKKETELQQKVAREIKWLESLQGLEGSLKEREDRYAMMGHLSAVANGKNKYGLTFQRFVLGALLDEVTVAATKRLKIMSRGRYHLHRTMDRARRNAAGGLDLEVFDTYTGVARGVATLSGGETFLASLSLALGLADVVQSHAGGIYLDTIFVDEGFGTLDTESLDFAIRTLIDLRESGRLVGIISHVPELKERIDARLEIQPVEKGSVARFEVT